MHAVNVHKGMYARYTLMLTRVALAPHTQILHISAFKLKFSVQNDPEEVCACGGGWGGGGGGMPPPVRTSKMNKMSIQIKKKENGPQVLTHPDTHIKGCLL